MEAQSINAKIIGCSGDKLRRTGYCWVPDQQHSFVKFILLFVFTAIFSSTYSQEKTLDYFISSALQNSPLLKDYNSQALINLIDSARIRATYKPQVNVKSTNLYAPVIKGWGYDEAISNIGNFSELITVDKQVINKKALQNEFNILRLQNDSLHVARKISEQDLKKVITSQYISAYGSWQQYLFNQQVYDLLAKEDTIFKKLTQSAVYRQTDYLTFLVTLQQQQLSVTQARIQFQNDYATLNYLSGNFDTSLTSLDTPALELSYTSEIENTVYYQKFTVDSLILRAADAQIDLSYKPKVGLYADAGYVSSLQYLPYKNWGVSAGVNLTIPIYDGRQRKMQHNKIAIAEQTRQHYREYFKTQYNQQIAQLSQQLNAVSELINQTGNQIRYTEGLLEANRKLLATGDVRIADYLIAISNYLNAKNIITQNTVTKLQLINQINYWSRK
jgi:outer membrane protein TolC